MIDVDGVIINSVKRLLHYYNATYSKNVDWKLIREWNLDGQCSFKNPEQEIEDIFADKMFYQKQFLHKGAMKYINKLSKKHEVYFCTLGNSKNLYYKSKFLNEYFPNIGIISLENMCDKGIVDMQDSIYIDDKLHNLLNSDAKYRWLFEHKKIRMNFNSHFNDHYHQVESVSKWKKIYDKVEMCNG